MCMGCNVVAKKDGDVVRKKGVVSKKSKTVVKKRKMMAKNIHHVQAFGAGTR
jgi:hypothetical protein